MKKNGTVCLFSILSCVYSTNRMIFKQLGRETIPLAGQISTNRAYVVRVNNRSNVSWCQLTEGLKLNINRHKHRNMLSRCCHNSIFFLSQMTSLFLQHIIIASITLLDSRNILILYRLCVSLCQYRLHDRVHCFMTFYQSTSPTCSIRS